MLYGISNEQKDAFKSSVFRKSIIVSSSSMPFSPTPVYKNMQVQKGNKGKTRTTNNIVVIVRIKEGHSTSKTFHE